MCLFEFDNGSVIDVIVQLSFLLAGCSIVNIGYILSIVLFGLLPIYIFLWLFIKKKLGFFKSKKCLLSLGFSIVISLLFISVFTISYIVLGAWG